MGTQMIPAQCMVSHKPPHSHADCVRACVASLLDLPTAEVEHFFHDGCDGMTGMERMNAWLVQRGYAPFFAHYDGSFTLAELLHTLGAVNPNAYYILFGNTENGAHAVVGKGGQIVHNPAWVNVPIVKAPDNGFWTVCVLSHI